VVSGVVLASCLTLACSGSSSPAAGANAGAAGVTSSAGNGGATSSAGNGGASGSAGTVAAAGAPTESWIIDNTSSIGGLTPSVLGSPDVTTTTELGAVVCFDGTADALIFDTNPLEGLAAFTVQVLFRPDADGPAQQRFIHFEEPVTQNRALIETRVTAAGWYLDTFLHYGASELTLVDAQALHAADVWYWAALSYDGAQMRHYVNAQEEAAGPVSFTPLGAGQMSIGVRLNRAYWFKGCVRELVITARALAPTELETIIP
jgi:hypothetical protein